MTRVGRVISLVVVVTGVLVSGTVAAQQEILADRSETGGDERAAFIRDVRPTRLSVGDVLVIEAPGVIPGAAAQATLSGRLHPRGSTQTTQVEGVPLTGHGAEGNRLLIPVDAALERALGGPARIEGARIEARQLTRTWTTTPGWRLELDLFAPSMRGLAAAVRPDGVPGWLVDVLLMAGVALGLHLLIAPITGIIVVWERKVAGRMQSRLGPNRVGPRGWLQWLADAIKLLLKEDLVPQQADPALFRLSPYLKWMSVFATLVVLPLSESAIVADLNVGVLYLLSVTSLTVIAILMGGWASNSKWSLLGGMRSAAQIVSYELPASLALLQVALLAGSLAPQEIVRAQGGLPHQWFVFANPLCFGCFFIYFISALAEGNRTPFDLPEAESELVAGYFTEYSGFRFSIFFLAEWTNMLVMGAIVATMFLGGWNVPFVSADALAASPALRALSMALMLAKVVTLVFVIIWVRWTLPRFRIDQLMNLSWKYFLPMAFVAFLGTAGWVWATARAPGWAEAMRWATFATGGVALLAWFVARVVISFRSTRLLHVGDRQFNWPFVERNLDKTRP